MTGVERPAPETTPVTDGQGARPRLVVFTDDFGGGTGNHLLQMMSHLDLDTWRPEILTVEPRTSRITPPVPVTRLPDEAISLYPFLQVLRFVRLRRWIRSRTPDLMHAYFFWPILFGRLLRASGVVPRLVENREDEGFAWGPHEYAWLRLTRRIPDRVVCVSEAVRRAAVRRERLDERRTVVIHNGVDLPDPVPSDRVRSLRRELGIPGAAPVVGMVSNLNRAVKGVDRFLDAAPLVLDAVPDARFVLVGGGVKEEELRRRVRGAGLSDRVLLVGYREDVDTFYALMDVAVLTSSSEGLSITLLEAMSHGLPVVATRVGGNPEIVEDGVTGFLVPFGDLEAFNRRVVKLLVEPDLRERLGCAGRERVRAHFGLRRAATSYARVYHDVLR